MTEALARLGRADLDAIAQLCACSVVQPPSVEELDGALFTDDQPAVIFGDPTRGVVAVVECEDGPHIRLLVVDTSARRHGLGDALLDAVEAWAREAGHTSLITGADPPYFLWPGVPTTETALMCLFEGRHYHRAETNFNMDVDLASIPDDPGGHVLALAQDYDEVDTWMHTHWSNWRPEVLRALGKGNLIIARGDGPDAGITAFCAFEVNRRGLLGPVAVRPDLMGRGMGKGVLLGALHELRRRGADKVSVVWIGPVVPYAAVGGEVSDVFFVYRKQL
ncbi:MAG TPA: GNAT family N-acetyltransferase [Acidimicrobiales bacterium]|jgi:GNAT superfamily N-acetyltransferase